MGEHKIALAESQRIKRITCKLCRQWTSIELESWKDDPPETFEHDCKKNGPRLSHPVTRDGIPIPYFPVGDRVVVERIPEEGMIGRIHVPEKHQQAQQYATVVAAGPVGMAILDDMGIGIGDTITFAKYTGIGWTWRPDPKSVDTRSVDILNVKDIQGGQELAQKMIDGRLGIALYCRDCGKPVEKGHVPESGSEMQYRFFEEVKETTNG